MIGKFVLVRTKYAGVHMGWMKEFQGLCGTLGDCRRLWSWTEAFSLNEIANNGCGEQSKISDPVDKIILTEIIEIMFPTEKSQENLIRSRNNNQ